LHTKKLRIESKINLKCGGEAQEFKRWNKKFGNKEQLHTYRLLLELWV
jgi:hypothetical protein